MVTVNAVRDAVVTALDRAFPDIDIYGEEIKQGFEGPCFFVKLFPVYHTKEFNIRYRRQHSFDVHYFPKNGDMNEDMHARAEQLYELLELLELFGGVCHGTKMRHEIVDGVLHFFVDYEFMVHKKAGPVDKMGPLKEVEGRFKDG